MIGISALVQDLTRPKGIEKHVSSVYKLEDSCLLLHFLGQSGFYL